MKTNLKIEYSEACKTTDGPILIASGPGSGKTQTIVDRAIYMINEQGIDAKNILLITYSKKAADQMRERISEFIEGDDLPFVGTFHSLCLVILRNYAFKIGIEKSFKIFDPTDQIELLQGILKGAQKKALQDLLKRISKLKNEFTSPMQAPFDLQEVYRDYEGVLKQKNALDFDDIIVKTVRLLSKHPEVLDVLPFIYVSVDEFQEVSDAQYKLIKLLSKRYGNVCVAGDSDQSIYNTKGANVNNFLQFGEDFKDVKLMKFEEDFRNTPEILETAEKVIEKNSKRMQAELISLKTEGSKVKICLANNDKAELDYILKTIEFKMVTDDSKQRKLSDFAVIYRTHLQGEVIEEAFNKAEIPYQILGNVPFHDRAEIKDILSYLRCIHDPNDELSMKRTILKFAKGIKNSTIEKITNYSTVYEIPFYQACLELDTLSLNDELKKSLSRFIQLHENLRLFATEHNLSDLIKIVLEKNTYFDTYKDKKRQEHVFELIQYSTQFDEMPPFEGLKAFIDETAMLQDKDVYNQSKDCVTLSTMHASKGLEFPIVFIAGASEGLTPYQFSEKAKNIEQERRLFYVGMTRAEEELHIIHANERNFFGKKHEMTMSQFVKDIPEELVEKREHERIGREKKTTVSDEQEAMF